MTPDGEWFVYLLEPNVAAVAARNGFAMVDGRIVGATSSVVDEDIRMGPAVIRGPLTVVVRSTRDATEHRYSAGDAIAGTDVRLQMSHSGSWIAFLKRQKPTAVVVVDLQASGSWEFPDTQDFSFTSGDVLLTQSYPDQRGTSLVTLQNLAAEKTERFSGVKSYALNDGASSLALLDGEGLKIHDIARAHTRSLLPSSAGVYEAAVWSKRGDAIAAVRSTPAGAELAVFTQLAGATPRKTLLSAKELSGFPEGYQLSTMVQWRDDERGLFVQMDPPAPVVKSDGMPKLVLWHSADDLLPGERKDHRAPSEWAYVSLPDARFVRLSDSTLTGLQPHARAAYVIAYDRAPYGPLNSDDGNAASQSRDYYLVEVATGRRRLLEKGLLTDVRFSIGQPEISPDGSVVLYQDNAGDFVVHDLKNGQRRNLTAKLPTKFYFPENRLGARPIWLREPEWHGPGRQGWTHDGNYVLVSDCYDVWALPLRGGAARNLTGNGRREDITYALDTYQGFNPARLSLETPLYFMTRHLETGDTGLAVYRPGAAEAKSLDRRSADTLYLRARDAEVYVQHRYSILEDDSYLLNGNYEDVRKLTDMNPQKREVQWPKGERYFTYKTAHGDVQRATLLLPSNYVEGRRYPTIVSIYRQGGAFHQPTAPFIFPELLHGYAVLWPTIVPRIDAGGQAALESVSAAVDAAVATGIVDRDRLGLTGHSFGGWETWYIVAHSNLFKAAIPYAGMTNLLSDFGAVYGGRWPKSHQGYGVDQPFLGGPWWDHWQAFIDNSPLYSARNIKTPLLIVHGDADDAVQFTQSVEMFNSLRRAGNKQAVLLQYVGEDHSVQGHSLHDYQARYLQFFDHFLKGAPAPQWWSAGMSRPQGQTPGIR